ncbi:hypothetical protein JCM11491_002536 [Sporobolomyces phaffii]
MSEWTPGGEQTQWSYQHHPPPPGPHLVQNAFNPTPPSNSSPSIQPHFDAWGGAAGYGQVANTSGYGQAGYGSHESAPGGHAQFRQGQLESYPPSQLHHPHESPYAPQAYSQPLHHSYQPVSNPPSHLPQPSSQPPRFENPPSNPSFRYDSNLADLPVPPAASNRLSATAQRFQNAAPSPVYDSSAALPQPSPSQVPQRSYAPSPRPAPAPASVQQYHRKVDELAMLEHRLAQLRSLLSRGTMAEAGPGANQPILANQRAHLEIQLREFKNRQVNLLNECEAFTRHFGPASSWGPSPVPANDTAHAGPGFSTADQRSRTFSAGAEQQNQYAQTGTAPQYSYDGQGHGGHGTRVGSSAQAQVYPTNHDRQHSSTSFGMTPSQPAMGRNPTQQGDMIESGGRVTSAGARAGAGVDPYQQGASNPPYPSHHRFNSTPNPAHPSYTHLSHLEHPEHYPSPNQPRTQGVPPPAPPSKPPHAGVNYSYVSSTHPPPNGAPLQPPFQHQQLEPQPLQPFPPPQRPLSHPSPSNGSGSTPASAQQQPQLPPGLRAQVDALAREQAAKAARSRSSTTPHSANQNPLQVLVKKAENGEMPVMTMSGLRKQSDVDREKKLEDEERERARAQAEKNRGAGTGTNAVAGGQKFPTTVLAELCRQGGGPTLAEMVMTIDNQVFWTQLQQTCAKRNINVFEEVNRGNFVVETKPVDLLQLFQTVVSRGGGYGKIDAGNAWPHVATLLSVSTRSLAAQTRIKEIYHRVLAPFEDIWASQMIKLREKQRAMDEARRVLGAMPAASTSTASPHLSATNQSSTLPQLSAPSPLATNARLPTNQAARRSPAETPAAPAPAPGSSSMFANPIAYNSLPPSNSYLSGPTSLPNPLIPLPPQQAPPVSEKSVTSSDLLAQARALRKNKPSAAAGGGAGGGSTSETSVQAQPSTTSPPQETSSTPQETASTSVPAPAPIADAPTKPTPATKSSAAQDLGQTAVAASGHVAPFSTGAPQAESSNPAPSTSETTRNGHPRKRKNDETENGAEEIGNAKTKTRNRSISNLEAPVVGQQTNSPHFNPFEINHFLPFTTAAPSIVPAHTAVPSQTLYSDLPNSAKSTLSQPSLRPDTSSTHDTISPQSISDGAILSSPGTINGGSRSLDALAGSTVLKRSAKSDPSVAAVVNPSSFDSISLSMSLDPQAASRPSTSWSHQDSAVSNGLSAFDPFGGGLDGYTFQSTGFEDGMHGLDPHAIAPLSSNVAGLPNWSPSGLDGFDFGSTFS